MSAESLEGRSRAGFKTNFTGRTERGSG